METVTFIKTPGKLHSSLLPNLDILSNTPIPSIKGVGKGERERERERDIPKTVLFWAIKQHVVVIPYQLYYYTLHNSPKECSFHPLCGRSLKSRKKDSFH
jgi:hypothetical protein